MQMRKGGLWPRYYHGWNIIAAVVLIQTASLGVAINCFSLFIHMWSDEFHISVSALVSAITIFSFGCAFVAMPAGMSVDRFSARAVMVAGLLLIIGAHAAIAMAGAGWQIILIYAILFPIAVSMSAAIPAQALVSRWFVRKRGMAMGLSALGLATAGVVFPPLISTLLLSLGWRETWWIFAGVIAVVVLPVALLVLRNRSATRDGYAYVPERDEEHVTVKLSVSEIVRRRNFWANICAFLPLQTVSFAVSVNLAPLVESRGFSLQTAGLLLSLFSGCALVSKLGVGILADRFGNKAPYILLSILAAGGCSLLASAQEAVVLYGSVMLLGTIGGIWTLLASTTAMEFGGSSFGRAYGVASALTPIGALGPPLLSLSHDWFGEYDGALYGLAVLALCAGISALFLRENPHAELLSDAQTGKVAIAS